MRKYEDKRINAIIKKSFEKAINDSEWAVRELEEWNILYDDIDKAIDFRKQLDVAKKTNIDVPNIIVNTNMWHILQDAFDEVLDILNLKCRRLETEKTEIMPRIRKKYDYYRLDFPIFIVEVGVLLQYGDKDFEEYNKVYDKANGYYDENTVIFLDYISAKKYAIDYVNKGVQRTYAIINSVRYNSEKIYGGTDDNTMDLVAHDLNSIIGGGTMEDYVGAFQPQLYDAKNVVYSVFKNSVGELREDFVGEEV